MAHNPAARSLPAGHFFLVTAADGKQEVWNVAVSSDKVAFVALGYKVPDEAEIEWLGELTEAQVERCGLVPGQAKKNG
jgi:hypothetical protein